MSLQSHILLGYLPTFKIVLAGREVVQSIAPVRFRESLGLDPDVESEYRMRGFQGNLPFLDRLSQRFHTIPVMVHEIMTMMPTIPKIALYDHRDEFELRANVVSVGTLA
ncbi:hypothetical protein K505DRAFT_341673 [Melanomma pulvis-pyrius CBS 109.77]|uniref:Uncharacterized protein n=1 Tax=Melanomma pulvis-pyrius CBS 109.77 TaxID=1314802 RepID=A0A6A6WYF4_9PLEO|nr:hypothetical protein K505DRAFT_341673 [Melanomma pulvis-pyrius CBS 109.77]